MTTPEQPGYNTLHADQDLDDDFARFMEALFQNALTRRDTRGLSADQAAAARDFLEVRDAFSLLRRELDLPPFAGPIDFQHQVAYFRGQLSAGEQQAAQWLAAAADGTAHLMEVDAHPWSQHHAEAARPSGDSGGITPLTRALAEADQHAATYQGTPEWQRIQAIRAAFGGLVDEIRKAAGSYYRELLGDVRAQGFLRAVTARTCHAISQASRGLAGRLEASGHRASPAWTAAWNLHRATANRASQVAGQLPKGHSLDIVGDMQAIMTTMHHRIGDRGPGDAARIAAAGFPHSPASRVAVSRTAAAGPRADRGVAADTQHER